MNGQTPCHTMSTHTAPSHAQRSSPRPRNECPFPMMPQQATHLVRCVDRGACRQEAAREGLGPYHGSDVERGLVTQLRAATDGAGIQQRGDAVYVASAVQRGAAALYKGVRGGGTTTCEAA